MSTISLTAARKGNSLLRPIALGGFIISVVHAIIQQWLVGIIFYKSTFPITMQFIASSLLGESAFAGGIGTVLLGVLLHLLISFGLAGVFILSASRIPFIRRHALASGVLYGFGAYIVLGFLVLPLSAAPTLPPPTLPLLIEMVVEHVLVIGLPLGLLAQRTFNSNK